MTRTHSSPDLAMQRLAHALARLDKAERDQLAIPASDPAFDSKQAEILRRLWSVASTARTYLKETA